MLTKSNASGMMPLLACVLSCLVTSQVKAQFAGAFYPGASTPTITSAISQVSYADAAVPSNLSSMSTPFSAFDPYQTNAVGSSSSPLFQTASAQRFESARGGRFWASAELLTWWMDDYSIPPLVTSAVPGTLATASPGVIGQANTRILLSDSLDQGVSLGGRFAAGFYFDREHNTGIQASVLGFQDDELRSFTGPTILARPFYLVEQAFSGEDAELISHPDLYNGRIDVYHETEFFLGDVLLSRRVCRDCNGIMNLLVGYRYGRLDECLRITDTRTVTTTTIPGVPIGTVFGEFDKFQTENHFHGAELGVSRELCSGPFSLDLLFKMALGNMHTNVSISGQTTATVPPAAAVVNNGGLLTQATNIGTYESDDFAIVPELGARLGYHLTQRIELTAGYSFVYFSQVARPGDQIDRNLNLTQLGGAPLVGAPFPQYRLVKTDFWAQGINFGAQLSF